MHVLGATAIACEDDSLAADNRAKLRFINSRLVEHVTQMCAHAPTQGVRVSVIVNVFTGSCDLGTLPPCILNVTHVPGSKLSFWTSVLTPALTSAFDIVWCFDNDLAIEKFAMHVAARTLLASNASVVQPCIPGARRGDNSSVGTRTTDIPLLRCHRMCASPAVPRRGASHLGGVKCLLREIRFIEVMTPMFSASAWALQHRRILSQIPPELTLESDRGLSEVWCSFFRKSLPAQPACGLMCLPLMHYHGRTIDVSNHSHVRYGGNRSVRGGTSARLITWSRKKFRAHYLRSASGWPPTRCQLPINRTQGALARAIPFLDERAPLDRPCGPGCMRRNAHSGW